jgi:hypothetical protein
MRSLNQPFQDQGRPAPRGGPISYFPGAVDAAPAPARNPRPPVQQAAPSAPGALVADPGDLVARALTILAEETEAWHARRAANLPPGSAR